MGTGNRLLEGMYDDLYIHDSMPCPCGEGKVNIIKDNTPGFRSRDLFCKCDNCREKYYMSDINYNNKDNIYIKEEDDYQYKYTYGASGEHYSYYYRPKNAKPVTKNE